MKWKGSSSTGNTSSAPPQTALHGCGEGMWAWRTGAGSAGCATEIGEYPLKTPMGFTIGTQSTKGNGQADCPAKGIYECPAKGCTHTQRCSFVALQKELKHVLAPKKVKEKQFWLTLAKLEAQHVCAIFARSSQ